MRLFGWFREPVEKTATAAEPTPVPRTHYVVWVRCTNCDSVGHIDLDMGTTVKEFAVKRGGQNNCWYCGCNTLDWANAARVVLPWSTINWASRRTRNEAVLLKSINSLEYSQAASEEAAAAQAKQAAQPPEVTDEKSDSVPGDDTVRDQPDGSGVVPD